MQGAIPGKLDAYVSIDSKSCYRTVLDVYTLKIQNRIITAGADIPGVRVLLDQDQAWLMRRSKEHHSLAVYLLAFGFYRLD